MGSFIIDTSRSLSAILRSVPISNIKISGFMGRYLEKLGTATLPSQYELLENTGRIDNFRIASGKIEGEFQGLVFNDSDSYKWSEAVSYYLASKKDKKLEEKLEKVIEGIKDAQDEDGYIDTYFVGGRKKERWQNLTWNHELYCAGHLIQAAIAHKRTAKKDLLFNVAKKFADHIINTFGPGKLEGTGGHPEIEMALVELYRETGEKKYLDLAKYFIDVRGKGLASKHRGDPEYFIDHKPFKELEEVVGHAVRMLYLCCGATDLYLETGDKELFNTLNRLWKNMTEKKMYITGGVGSRYEGESFGEEYELPNRRAYAETCAAIANFMWNWRMLLATGDGKFSDLMEQVLYNGLLSGISLDGKHYFYVNPLEDRGNHQRQKWFKCACCPPNVARLIASFPGYIYTISKEGIWIHFYEENEAEINYKEEKLKISQKTNYPWSGNIEIKLNLSIEKNFDLFLRIPEWTNNNFDVYINGEKYVEIPKKGYLKISRNWLKENVISIDFPMNIKLIKSHPFVRNNFGKIVIMRGPIVYCAEYADNKNFDVWNLILDKNMLLKDFHERIPGLGKIVTINGEGFVLVTDNWLEGLYEEATQEMKTKKVNFKLIPYYSWANREIGPMVIWLNKR